MRNVTTNIERLPELFRRVNELCAEAKDKEIKGAINWADLGCVGVAIALDGPKYLSYYRVEISEADPDNQKFHKFIGDALLADGWGEVEVVTEW